MERQRQRRLLITRKEELFHGVKVIVLSAAMAVGLTCGIGGLLMWTAGVVITWKDITSGHFADTATCLTILGAAVFLLVFGLAARRRLRIEETIETVTRESVRHLPVVESLVRPSAPPVEQQLLRASAHNPTVEPEALLRASAHDTTADRS